MKYDCPKCQRNLKGEGWSLWTNHRRVPAFTFACPNCGAAFRIRVHVAEIAAFVLLGLTPLIVPWLFVAASYAPPAIGLIVIVFWPMIGLLILAPVYHLLRNKQRYAEVPSHAV